VETVNVFQNISGTDDSSYFDQLVEVVCAFEEGFTLEEHTSHHATSTPNV
jgi:hypothetical protein